MELKSCSVILDRGLRVMKGVKHMQKTCLMITQLTPKASKLLMHMDCVNEHMHCSLSNGVRDTQVNGLVKDIKEPTNNYVYRLTEIQYTTFNRFFQAMKTPKIIAELFFHQYGSTSHSVIICHIFSQERHIRGDTS